MRIINEEEILNIAKTRAKMETDLGKAIYRILNSSLWLEKIRHFVALACYQLVSTGIDEALLNGAMQVESRLEVWNKGVGIDWVRKLRDICNNRKRLTAGDCSDLIRLFGAVIEDKALLSKFKGQVDVNKSRDSKRVGGKEKHWGDSRARSRSGANIVSMVDSPHSELGRNVMLENRRLGLDKFAGMSATRLLDRSTVKKIDFAFALPEGCDISGTTADSIFFVEHMRNFIGDAVLNQMTNITKADIRTIQLLPVASMVSQAHHTLLECALTLTLNKFINYHAGYYETLIPIGGCDTNIENVFREKAQAATDKQLFIMCYRHNFKVEAYMMMTKEEIRLFKDVAKMNDSKLLEWKARPLYRNKEDIDRMLRNAYLYPVTKQ